LRDAGDCGYAIAVRNTRTGAEIVVRRRGVVLGGLLSCMTGVHHARAQSQSCAGAPVPAEAVRCPDGSIPSFSFDVAPALPDGSMPDGSVPGGSVPGGSVPGGSVPGGSGKTPKTPATSFPKGSLFGIWHTNLPGTPYASAIDVPGYYMMNIRPGIAPGDLTIDPNGAYAWNSIRGTAGRWMKNPRRPEVLAVLIDSVLGKQWTITMVDGHLKIENGSTIYIGRR
jgi:hypothetical protein